MANRASRHPSWPKHSIRGKRQGYSSEILGIGFIFLAISLLLSLMSFNPKDPSWISASDQEVQNYLGRFGASLSETLFQFTGLPAFALPLGFLYLGIYILFPREKKKIWSKAMGIILFSLVLSGLFSLLSSPVSWGIAEIAAGGLLGNLISHTLSQYFNHTGSILILIAFLTILLSLATHISILDVSSFFSRILNFAFKRVRIKVTKYKKEKQRKKMRKRVKQKYMLSEPQNKKSSKGKKKSKTPEPKLREVAPPHENLLFPEMERKGDYNFPPLSLLDLGKALEKIDKNELYEKKQIIEEKLMQFKVEGEVREYHPGPIITTYEYFPHPGVKVSQVASLTEDLSLALGAESVRIQRIPGKSSLGIEIPNNRREIIKLRDVIQTKEFLHSPSKLTIGLGKTIHGEPYITDLSIMPHLLIAGATGSGKSVAINSIIASILYKATPDEVKLILIDPKRVEFSLLEDMPHLLCPIVKDPRKAEEILLDSIKKMEERYHALGHLKVRNIEQYNTQVKKILREKTLSAEERERFQPMPYLVIIIDELAELMMIGAQEVEYCIARLAQLARAVGIHLVMATQRPSTDVITGTIKNNFSSRIAFRVPSKIDSRIIIDTGGADKLLGRGDMLFLPPNLPRIVRLHSSYISLPEMSRLMKFVKEQGKPHYDQNIIKVLKSPAGKAAQETEEKDELFQKAVELILLTGQASASYLQRKLKLGYARAARIIDQMESEGIVGPSEGSKPREILVDPDIYLKQLNGEE